MDDMVTITRAEYDGLLADREHLEDIAAYDRAKAEGGDSIPDELVGRILDGESPLRVYREFRGLTQSGLADASDVNRVLIANIERGTRNGSIETMKKLAAALGIGVDDLI